MATLTINTDEKTAENFYAFCEELGLDMSTAMTLFMKACLREQKIIFIKVIKVLNIYFLILGSLN